MANDVGNGGAAWSGSAGRWALLLGLGLLLAGCGPLGERLRHLVGDRQVRLADDVVIERDEWGVPHVRGSTDAAVAFGVAWAMAEDGYWQVEEAYLRDLGLSSYYYGVRQLADDLVRDAFEVAARARAEYAAAPAEIQQLVGAYADGLNYYLRRYPQARRVIGRYEPWMVLARARELGTRALPAGTGPGELAALVGATDAGSREPDRPATSAALAVAGSRSGSGRALLLTLLQRSFTGSEQPYELEVASASGWHVYGFARLGTPVPHTGHNGRIAWAHAPAPDDSAVVTRLMFNNPADSLAYAFGEAWQRAEPFVDTVLVNTAAGVTRRGYRYLRTPYGPVLARRGDTAFAVRPPRTQEAAGIAQWYRIGRAESLADFTEVLDAGGLPGRRFVYADAEGISFRGGAGGAERDPASGLAALNVDTARFTGVAGDSGWTAALLERLAFGAEPRARRADIEQLVHEWEQVGGRDWQRAFALDTTIERLRAWDGRVTAEALGPVLYQAWLAEYQETEVEPAADGASGAALPTPFPRFRALERARARVRQEFGKDSVPWGETSRLQRRPPGEERFREGDTSLVVTGLPAGSPFVLETVRGQGPRRYAVAGTAAVLLAELGTPPSARSVVVFGQSAVATSPHYFDQAQRYAAGELKPTRFGGRGGTVVERYHPGRRALAAAGETPPD